MTTLVEKAKKVLSNRNLVIDVNEEKLDLILAYLNQEITSGQASEVLGIHTSNFPNKISSILRSAIIKKMIIIKKRGEQSDD